MGNIAKRAVHSNFCDAIHINQPAMIVPQAVIDALPIGYHMGL